MQTSREEQTHQAQRKCDRLEGIRHVSPEENVDWIHSTILGKEAKEGVFVVWRCDEQPFTASTTMVSVEGLPMASSNSTMRGIRPRPHDFLIVLMTVASLEGARRPF